MRKKYYEYKIENLIVVNKIITVHHFEFEKDFVSSGEAHAFWEFVYAEKGNVLLTANDKTRIPLKEGETYFHKPDEYHALSCDGKKGANVVIVSFSCKSGAMRFFEDKKIALDQGAKRQMYAVLEEGKRTFFMPYSNPETKKMALSENPALGGLQTIKNLLELFLIGLIRSETEKSDSGAVFLKKEEYDGNTTKRIIALMKEKIYENPTVDEIAKTLNYSKSYIFRQFKKSTGTTLMNYFTSLKIETAKRLLREGQLNVSQIAEKLAFDTPNYFSKTFKKYVSLTPLQYKSRNY